MALYNRTGTELLIVGWRSDFDQYTRPRSFATSDAVEHFVQLACKMDLEKFAKRGECYLLSGIEGTYFLLQVIFWGAYTFLRTQELILPRDALAEELGSNTATQFHPSVSPILPAHRCLLIVVAFLGEAAAPRSIGKINYKNFDKITEKYGIICVGWPLERFCCPGDINSMPELQVLQNAFQSGAAHFRCLSDDELDQWRKERRLKLVEANQTATADHAVSDPSAPPPVPEIRSSTMTEAPGPTPSDSLATDATATNAVTNVHANNASLSVLAGPSTAANIPTSNPQPLQSVFTVDGPGLVQKKPRKTRSDKGKKRGSN